MLRTVTIHALAGIAVVSVLACWGVSILATELLEQLEEKPTKKPWRAEL
jgi:hypothetical protein